MDSQEQITDITKLPPEEAAKHYAYDRLLILIRLPLQIAKLITILLVVTVPWVMIVLGVKLANGNSRNLLRTTYSLAADLKDGKAIIFLLLIILLWLATSLIRRFLFSLPAYSPWWMRVAITAIAFTTTYIALATSIQIFIPYLARIGYLPLISIAASFSVVATVISILGETMIQELKTPKKTLTPAHLIQRLR